MDNVPAKRHREKPTHKTNRGTTVNLPKYRETGAINTAERNLQKSYNFDLLGTYYYKETITSQMKK